MSQQTGWYAGLENRDTGYGSSSGTPSPNPKGEPSQESGGSPSGGVWQQRSVPNQNLSTNTPLAPEGSAGGSWVVFPGGPVPQPPVQLGLVLKQTEVHRPVGLGRGVGGSLAVCRHPGPGS